MLGNIHEQVKDVYKPSDELEDESEVNYCDDHEVKISKQMLRRKSYVLEMDF